MKKIILLSISIAILTFSACKKSNSNNNNDLTSSIVGHYTNSASNTDIVVNKIDNNRVSITVSSGTGSGSYDVAFSNVTMNTSNSFTLNSVTLDGQPCVGKETFTGTGTHSGNNISLFMTVVGTNPSGPTPYDCSGTSNENVSATK